MNQLSTLLRSLREAKGLRKSELARILDISSQLYGQYEPDSGEGKEPGFYFSMKWKEVFDENLIDKLIELNSDLPDHGRLSDPESLRAEIKGLARIAEQIAHKIPDWSDPAMDIVRKDLSKGSESGKDKRNKP